MRSRGRPLPPGPRPLPIVGNLFDIPKRHPWRVYQEFSKQYGKIISFQATGQTLVVVDDPKIAFELLEKRSALYSSRPDPVVVELVGWAWNLAFIPYGHAWRSRRRVVWQYFHPGVVSKYYASLQVNARRVLGKLLSGSAEELSRNARYSLATSLIEVAYGLQSAEVNDKHISNFEEAIASLALLLSGTSLVEFFPFMARLPHWLPGMGELRRMAHYHRATTAVKDETWDDAKRVMIPDSAPTSVAGALLQRLSSLEDGNVEEDQYRDAVAVAYAAAIDTTHASFCAFFIAMSLHPDVQKKAQEQLDAVIGFARLPSLDDRANMPYIDAIVKETLRWHTAVPMGIPHVTTADDEYDGYFIPEGSVVMVNAWSMLHDPQRYPQPEVFDPDRFMKDGLLNVEAGDPAHIAFGFGRRICPGRYFAEAALFIYIASVLHTLEISPPLDKDGRPIHIEPRLTSELVSHLEDCRCNMKPRSGWAADLIYGSRTE